MTPAGQGKVSFDLPDDHNWVTLLAKLREQEREQEDEDNLVEFLKTQEKTHSKTKKKNLGNGCRG